MAVLEILSWRIDPDAFTVSIKAVVEDMVELSRWHWDCPSEYTFGTCEGTILLSDLGDWPSSEEEQLAFVENYQPFWTLVEEPCF